MTTARRPAAIWVRACLVVGLLVPLVACGDDDGETRATSTTTASTDPKPIVVGEVDAAPASADGGGPGVVVDDGQTLQPRPEPGAEPGLVQPDGNPPGPPVAFRTQRSGVDDTVFVLVAGSDARPGEPVTRSRADSIHIVAVNPTLGRGTIVGIPRDSWVEVPGRGMRKVNSALALGGPQLLADTLRRRTGLPLSYYVVTGFEGLVDLTNALGGVDVLVERRMNDRSSGARFERGWHLFEGVEVLAYSRNRKDVALGDFSRSQNQGRIMLAVLAKLRAEVGDDAGVDRWLDALRRFVELDLGLGELAALATTARRVDPSQVDNVVAPGRVGRAGGASVVFLGEDADRLFADVAADGVIGAPTPAPTTTTTTTTTSTTTTSTTTRPPVVTTAAPSPTSTTLLPLDG